MTRLYPFGLLVITVGDQPDTMLPPLSLEVGLNLGKASIDQLALGGPRLELVACLYCGDLVFDVFRRPIGLYNLTVVCRRLRPVRSWLGELLAPLSATRSPVAV